MINSATAQLRIAPELLQTSKEVKDAHKKEEDMKSASSEPEVAPRKVPHPTNEGVGRMVNVEA